MLPPNLTNNPTTRSHLETVSIEFVSFEIRDQASCHLELRKRFRSWSTNPCSPRFPTHPISITYDHLLVFLGYKTPLGEITLVEKQVWNIIFQANHHCGFLHYDKWQKRETYQYPERGFTRVNDSINKEEETSLKSIPLACKKWTSVRLLANSKPDDVARINQITSSL